MSALYFIANSLNYLVAGTGNRSELTIGYFTKHGDGAVDLLPLGRLLKSEVRELATSLEMPQSIIDKVPSAGLWVGQSDEDEIGFRTRISNAICRRPRSGVTGARHACRTSHSHHRAQARSRAHAR